MKKKNSHKSTMSNFSKTYLNNQKRNKQVKNYTKKEMILYSVTPAITGGMGGALLLGTLCTVEMTMIGSLLGAYLMGASAYHDLQRKK